MVKAFFKFTGLALLTMVMTNVFAFAQTSDTEPNTPSSATFQSRCSNLPEGYPQCATSPSECASKTYEWTKTDYETKSIVFNKEERLPFNCIFLQEPIGGKPGYDLYKAVPNELGSVSYQLWFGEALTGAEVGPLQAILAFEEGKESQGPFGLLYNYLGLVYNFLSGIIIGFVVLIAIVGGIRMTASAGNQEAFGAGKNMIVKALIGLALWFTASVILYTINPTFFAF